MHRQTYKAHSPPIRNATQCRNDWHSQRHDPTPLSSSLPFPSCSKWQPSIREFADVGVSPLQCKAVQTNKANHRSPGAQRLRPGLGIPGGWKTAPSVVNGQGLHRVRCKKFDFQSAPKKKKQQDLRIALPMSFKWHCHNETQ